MPEMEPDRFARIADLFEAAREQAPDDRVAFVTGRAGGDSDLVSEVLELLGHHDDESDALDVPMTDRLAIGAPDDQLPETIGRYRIIRRLGEGGMGVVYLAEQDSPQRTVALKVLKLGFASEEMWRRFEHETDVLARLQHPGVAQIYDAGTTETPHGRLPYFAMEFVDGQAITDFVVNNNLSIAQRVRLLIDVCHAVQHAHQHGVIHRDLKPANILVGEDRRPRILDFGVARTVDAERQATMATAVGQLVGTLPYMSPEQVTGRPDLIDTRSDVYALGVVVYEVLAGRMPHQMQDESMTSVIRMIESVDAPLLGSVDRVFRGDLETIVSKTLEKEPDRRYESASELAADLERYLDHQPIQARPVSTFYQLSKFARRNKGTAFAVLLLAFVLLLSAAGGTILAIWALDERDTALQAKAEQSRLAREAEDARGEEERQRGIADAKAAEAVESLKLAVWQEYVANLAAADASYRTFDQSAGRRRLSTMDTRYRVNWEWRHLAARLLSPLRRIQHIEDATKRAIPVYNVEITPDGSRFVTGCRDGSVRFIDSATGQLLKAFVPHSRPITDLGMSQDGALVATCGHDGKICVFDVESMSGKAAWTVPDDGGESKLGSHVAIEVLPDDRVAVGRSSGEVEIWHWPTLERVHLFKPAKRPISLDVSHDGTHLAIGNGSWQALVYDTTTFDEVHRITLKEQPIGTLAWSPDGRSIATSTRDFVRVWDVETGEMQSLMRGVTDVIVGIDFSADGSQVITGSKDGTVRLWDAETGIIEEVMLGHDLPIGDIAYASEVGRIVSGSDDGHASLFDPQLLAVVVHRSESSITSLSTSPASNAIALGHGGGKVTLIDPETTTVLDRWTTGTRTHDVEHDRTGRWVITADDVGVGVWDAFDGRRRHELADTRAWTVAAHPSDDRIASGFASGVVQIHDLDSGALLTDRSFGSAEVRRVVWVGEADDRLAVSTKDGRVFVWDVVTDDIVMEASVTNGWWVKGLTVDPTGELVVGHHGWVVIAWRIADGTEAFRCGERNAPVNDLMFIQDGKRLVVASGDRSIRLYDVETRDTVLTMRGHDLAPDAIVATMGETILVSADRNRLRLWDTRLPSEREAYLGRRAEIASRLTDSIRADVSREGTDAVFATLAADDTMDPETRSVAMQILGRITREAGAAGRPE